MVKIDEIRNCQYKVVGPLIKVACIVGSLVWVNRIINSVVRKNSSIVESKTFDGLFSTVCYIKAFCIKCNQCNLEHL